MKVVAATITSAPDLVEGEIVWLKSDSKRVCPMNVVKTYFNQEASVWFVTCMWIDKNNMICEDDFSPKLLSKQESRRGKREIVFTPDW